MFELKKQIDITSSDDDKKVPTAFRRLKLALLACENNPPYGPPHHTANLFVELFHQAAVVANESSYELQIDVYNVTEEEYPTQWSDYQGYILPGSFSAAYETEPWILTLQKKLQTHIVAHERPTLAVCFGHQIMAHSFFPHGKAVKMPQARAGRHDVTMVVPSTSERTACLGTTSSFSQFFSHGDNVEKLPDTAVACGSSDPHVPVQIAAYYGSNRGDSQPYCISFQAHPEYATEANLGTLLGCLKAMKERNAMSEEEYQRLVQDAYEMHESVKAANLDVMIRVFQTMGWFPTA